MVSNLLIHREFANPFPKNPTIAKFFKEIGWVDELGSGVRNITKYNKVYSGAIPTFIEGDVFLKKLSSRQTYCKNLHGCEHN